MTKCHYCKQNLPTEEKPQRRYTGSYPYGLKRKPGGHAWETVKDYEEIATIDTICHRWRQGDSLNAIVKWLDHSGIKNRVGNTWHPTQIKRILVRNGLL